VHTQILYEFFIIHHLYATAGAAQGQCLLVFATANNDRAMVLLNASSGTT